MKRILIIEDDEDLCSEFSDILKDEGYSVTVANNGNEGMRLIEDNGYDVILLDLKMQGLNGYDVLKYVKKTFPQLKIMVITGSPLGDEILRNIEIDKIHIPDKKDLINSCLKLADCIINKPFDVKSIIAKIKTLAE